MNIRFKNALEDEDVNTIYDIIYSDEKIKSIFKNRNDRIEGAEVLRLILNGTEPIGFYALVTEKGNYDFYFLDVGIIKEYRGRGISRLVQEDILKFKTDKFIIAETKVNNKNAMNSLIYGYGKELFELNDRAYFLLPQEKTEEFIEQDGMEKLTRHIERPSEKRMMIEY